MMIGWLVVVKLENVLHLTGETVLRHIRMDPNWNTIEDKYNLAAATRSALWSGSSCVF